MSQPIRGQGGHLVFPISPKNTNLVEDVEILLPVKFRWIRFSGFRGEVEIVSANQRPGRPSCFSERPEKHKLGRGGWDLASCKVWLNSVQWFQRRSRKCEKLTTDGRRTDDGQRMITIVHLSLRLRCTKNELTYLIIVLKSVNGIFYFIKSIVNNSWCCISRTSWSRLAWHLMLTFVLLTWKSRGMIYSSRLGYCFTPYQRLWLYNGAPLVAFYDTLGIRRTYSRLKLPASSRGNSSRTTKFETSMAERSTVITCTRWCRVAWPYNMDHLLITDYLPTTFEAPGAKRFWVISNKRLR